MLLILSGVTISAIVNNNSSLMEKAKEAREKTEEAEAKEKVALMLTEWKMLSLENGTPSLKDFLDKPAWQSKRQAYNIVEADTSKENEYIVTVSIGNKQLYVPINMENSNTPLVGEPSTEVGGTTVTTSVIGGYKFVGDTDGLQIKVNATAPNGETITGITSANSLQQISTTVTANSQTAESVFKVTTNGTYNFTVTESGGTTKQISMNVNNFLSTPVIPNGAIVVGENTITINTESIESQYPAEAGVTFKYYYGTTSGACNTEITGNTVNGLTTETTYYVTIKAYKGNEELESEESEVETTDTPQTPLYSNNNITVANTLTVKTDSNGIKYWDFKNANDYVGLPNIPNTIDFEEGYRIEITAEYETIKQYMWVYYIGNGDYPYRDSAIGLLQSTVHSPIYQVNIVTESDQIFSMFNEDPGQNTKHTYLINVEKNLVNPSDNEYYNQEIKMDGRVVCTNKLPKRAVVNANRTNNKIGYNDSSNWTFYGKMYSFKLWTNTNGLIFNCKP